MKKQPIRVLVVEDNPADAELMILKLRKAGFAPDWRRIQTQPDFLEALESACDLILADYSLPNFSGRRALELLKERGLDIPFLLISGTIGEEVAVEAIKAGAYDYLLKGKLTRLGPAVRNALKEKAQRDETQAAEYSLRERVDHSRSLLRLSRELEHAQTYAEALRAAQHELGTMLGYQNVWVYLLTEDQKYFRALTGFGRKAEQALEELPMMAIAGDRMLEEIAAAKEIVVVEEAATDERTNKEMVAALGNRSIVNVPIRLFDGHLGALGMGTFGDEGVRVPSLSEQEYLSALASHIAVSLDRIHLLTRSKQAEQELREAESKYRTLVERLPMIVYVNPLEDTTYTSYVSPQIKDILGFNPEEWLADPKLWEKMLHPEDRHEALDEAQRVKNNSESFDMEYRMIARDGHEVWFRDQSTLLYDSEGRPLFWQGLMVDITGRKQAEAALQKTEEKYRNIFENAIEGIYQSTPEGRYITANPALAQMLGYDSPEEMIATVIDLNRQFYVAPGRRAEFKALMEQHGAVTRFESQVYCKDGSLLWVFENGRAIRDEHGVLLYYEGITQDITVRRQVEQALRESEANLLAAQSITHLGSWELDLTNLEDLNSNTLRWSDEVFRIFGLQPREIEVTNENFFRAVHPEDRDKISAAVAAAIETGETYSLDHRIIRPDGSERVVHEQSQIVFDEHGRPLKMVGTIQDVTESRRAEQALRSSEERYRLLFERNPLPMWVYDLETLAFLAVNEAAVEHYGYSRIEFRGMTIKDIRPPEELGRLTANLQSPRQSTEKSGPWKHRKKDGTLIDVEIVSHEISFGDRSARLILANDITERNRAEQALASERQLLRTLVDLLPDRIYVKDAQSRFLLKNLADLRAMGASSADEIVGKSDFDFYPEELAAQYFADDQAIIQSGKSLINHEEPGIDAEGHPCWILTTKVPLRNSEGGVTGLVGIGRDITERKQHESELEAIVKMSSALRAAASRSEMPLVILDQLFDLLKIEAAALATRDPLTGDTVIELARGAWSGGTGRRIPPGEGISGQVIDTGQPYLNNDINTDPRYIAPYSAIKFPAVACVPLIAHEQTIGALWIAGKRPIETTELQLLTAISNIAASALHRASLFEQTQRRLQQISALHSIDIAISSSFDLRFTLNILLEQVAIHLGVDATDVLLLDPHTQVLEYVAGRGFVSAALDRMRFRLGEGVAGRAALERHTVSVANLSDDDSLPGRSEFVKAEKFVSYYGVPLIAKGQIKGVLEIFHRRALHPDRDWLSFLETLADQAALAINDANMFDSLQRSNTELIMAYDATIEGWSRALELRDHETEGHAQRVTELSLKLARLMQLSLADMLHMRRGALLHDIGKMGIPDSVLLKPGALTEQEWEIMRKHPTYAYEMLRPVEFLRPALDIPYCHHEKWDGTGYPRKLRADTIPLTARIFSIVDAWDALLSDRPYRRAWSKEKVRQYISSESGKHFDPTIAEIFLRMEETA